jgi:Flagellar basal body-associated protein
MEDFVSKANAKVALDIDDAPFLVDDEPEAPPPVEEAPAEPVDTTADDEARAAALRRRKRIILAGLASVFLLIASAAIWFFILREVPAEEEASQGATVIVVPSPESITGPSQLSISLEPFLVPQYDAEGKVRMLRIQVTSVTTEEALIRETKDKVLVLRDAIYYYLRNRTHEHMLDPGNLPLIKQDILDIINGYLAQGKLEDLFVENYLLR